MPIYAYKCRECGKEFDKFRSIHDSDTDVACPECGKTNPERCIASFSHRSSSGSSGGFRPT